MTREESPRSEEKTLMGRGEAARDMRRPALIMDGGNVDLVDVGDDGVVSVRLVGACQGCPASTMTLQAGLEATLKAQVPEGTGVESVL